MPLFNELIFSSHSIYLWKITEPEDELTAGLPKFFIEQIKSRNKLAKRRTEKLTQARLLMIAGIDPLLLSYSPTGKPHIHHHKIHVSFSHSGKITALMVSNSSCGIDIEQDNPKIKIISPKFLNEKERHLLSCPGALNYIWSIKEAVFKYFGERVLFKDDILILGFNATFTEAEVLYKGYHGHGRFTIQLDRFENYYLAYTKAYQLQ